MISLDPIIVRGKFVGYTEVNMPPTFHVRVSELKPLNTSPNSFPVYWRGEKGRDFKFGGIYSLVIRYDRPEWDAIEAMGPL